jgi:aspartate/methionine/tyrosine aminotransferase
MSCSLLIDEFYSHYIWRETADGDGLVSAARYVEDVDSDPLVLFDGLTKNWRYPGWRCSWIVGPRQVIDAVASSGSFLDGGGSKPLQRSAVRLLAPDVVEAETEAIRAAFLPKRTILADGLRRAGVRFDLEPEGTFYCWGDISGLPPAIDDGMSFFRAALEKQVICVPGEFFDVNPGKRRSGRPSRFRHYVRFSFGPDEASVTEGVRRIEELVREASGRSGPS